MLKGGALEQCNTSEIDCCWIFSRISVIQARRIPESACFCQAGLVGTRDKVHEYRKQDLRWVLVSAASRCLNFNLLASFCINVEE